MCWHTVNYLGRRFACGHGWHREKREGTPGNDYLALTLHESTRQCDNDHELMELTSPRRRLAILFLLIALAQLLLGQSSHQIHSVHPPEYTFKVIQAIPHDATAFTQGLAYRDGFLYESTGLNGRSSLRKVRLETGEVVQRVDLAQEFFGEGMTLVKNEVVQLTWLSHTGFVYNLSDFRLLRPFLMRGKDGV